MKRLLSSVLLVLLMAGCSEPGSRILGTVPDGPVVTIAFAQNTNAGASVVLRGEMIQKCPVAGCWFTLRDGTGTIKVDTKNAGFVVVDLPLNTTLFVAGHVTSNGTERLFEATGARY